MGGICCRPRRWVSPLGQARFFIGRTRKPSERLWKSSLSEVLNFVVVEI
jgi:hypothetical protein